MLRLKKMTGCTRRLHGQSTGTADVVRGLAELSQKQELAGCNLTLFFCTITQVTVYLNVFPSLFSWPKVLFYSICNHYL